MTNWHGVDYCWLPHTQGTNTNSFKEKWKITILGRKNKDSLKPLLCGQKNYTSSSLSYLYSSTISQGDCAHVADAFKTSHNSLLKEKLPLH